MKVFWISMLLLILLAVGMTANHIYIKEVFGTMEQMLERLSEAPRDARSALVDGLIDYWEGELALVSLSVSHTIVDRIGELAAILHACVESGDHYGFYSSLALLRDAIGDMMRFEKPSLGSLL